MFPFIENGKIIGFAESVTKAEENLAGGFTVVFINEKHSVLNESGYFVKADSADFEATNLSSILNQIVKTNSPFNDLTTRNNGEDDFQEMSVWSLKDILIQTVNKTNNIT